MKEDKNQAFEEILDIETAEREVPVENKELVEKMFEAGVYLGRKRSYWHPNMKPYILGVKNGLCIIDLVATAQKLKEAAEFLKNLAKKGEILLFVGTKINQADLIKNLGEELKYPYVFERWLGGTLTNFKALIKRIKYFIDFETKMESGEFEKYTKLERTRKAKELEILRKKFNGLRNLTKLPAALVIVDAKKENTALREAKRMKIPIVAFCGVDTDPAGIDYVIPANTDVKSSIELLINYIVQEIKH